MLSFSDVRSAPSSAPTSDVEMVESQETPSVLTLKETKVDDLDFIPIGTLSSDEDSDSDDGEIIRRRSSMTEKDFISL